MKPALTLPLLFAAAGCTVMVNGKPRRIGGGTDPAAAQPQPTPTATAAPAPAAARPGPDAGKPAAPPPPVEARTLPAGQTIKLDRALTAVPLVTRVEASLDTTFSKVHGRGNSPDCGQYMTATPIASVVVDRPIAQMHLAVAGGMNDGFVLRRGDALWFSCTHSTGQVPTITGLKDGWQPGRYDIYPIARYAKAGTPMKFAVELFDPETPSPWGEVKQVAIAGKLAAPMFVEVTAQPDRRMLRSAHSGWGCDKVAMPDRPDLALVLERPVPGLIVRPLPTTTPVTLRRELQDAKKPDRGCPKHERRSYGSSYVPSYAAPSELHFGTDHEGTFGISIGTPDDRPVTVTLMIYDASTTLDPLASYPYPGDAGALDRRWLGYYFPQLDLRELDARRDHAHAELTAKLFAAASRDVLVYAKLDLDKDIASGGADEYPKKNEPLLVLGIDGQRAEVLTADGLRFHVKQSHLLLQPEGPLAIPAAPRSLGKLDIGRLIPLLPPSAKSLATAREKRLAAYDKCVDRTWAPYGRQLPRITRPSGVDIVVYESARTKNIRAAGERAVERACGSDAQRSKLTEAERAKMAAAVDKDRARLLAVATANLR
jgi:hypothetical protein